MTLIKSQTQIREWRCAFRGSVSESAGAARDGARPRQTSHSSAGGRPTACSPALISDRDLFPTRGRETAAASNCHFGLAPGASAKVPLPGISARPGFSQDSGELPAEQKQKKKKKKGSRDSFSDGGQPGKRLGEPAGDHAVMSNLLRLQPPALPPQIRVWGSPSRERGGASSLSGVRSPRPGAAKGQSGRFGGVGRRGRYINPEQDREKAGKQGARGLGQTP